MSTGDGECTRTVRQQGQEFFSHRSVGVCIEPVTHGCTIPLKVYVEDECEDVADSLDTNKTPTLTHNCFRDFATDVVVLIFRSPHLPEAFNVVSVDDRLDHFIDGILNF